MAVQTAGADALGLVFTSISARHIEINVAQQIAEAVTIGKVGLFVDPTEAEVKAAISLVELDVLQFQGEEPESFCSAFGKPYIKALPMRPGINLDPLMNAFSSAWAIQLDAYVPGQAGGTGEVFDWRQWPQDVSQRLILAGGLTPQNVAQAIDTLHPFGVDVSGGVEHVDAAGKARRGDKDSLKIQQFVTEVRRADSQRR